MTTAKPKQCHRGLWIYISTLFFALIPVIHYLHYNDYPLLTPEASLLITGVFFAGLIWATLVYLCSSFYRLLLYPLTVIVCLSFLLPLTADLWLMPIYFCLLCIMFFMQTNFIQIMGIAAGTFLLSLFILPSQQAFSTVKTQDFPHTKVNENLPSIIHIILDAHIALSALPQNIPTLNALHKRLSKRYQQDGFSITPSYSHYIHTLNSIPNFLNYSASDEQGAFLDVKHKGIFYGGLLSQSRYFDDLAKMGYVLRFYQPNYIDYCHVPHDNKASCYTYPMLSARILLHTNIRMHQKVAYLLQNYLASSILYQTTMGLYQYQIRPVLMYVGFHPKPWPWDLIYIGSVAAKPIIPHLTQQILAHPRGTVFFAHVMMPHAPYVYDTNCHLHPDIQQWLMNAGPEPFANNVKTRRARYIAYGEQLACVSSQINTMLQTLKQHHLLKQSTIILQGDHGSRIPLHIPYESEQQQLSQQDLRDAYQALYLIHWPQGQKPLDLQNPTSLNQLLALSMERMMGKAVLPKATPMYIYFTMPSFKKGEALTRFYKPF